jgi:hypothetical protein
VAPRFAAPGEQQDEAFRQLTLLREHETRAPVSEISAIAQGCGGDVPSSNTPAL